MKIIDLKNLATLIRDERKKQNLTQSDLAFACNVGLRFIVDLEKAKPTCQIGKVLNVINTLGIELEIKDL